MKPTIQKTIKAVAKQLIESQGRVSTLQLIQEVRDAGYHVIHSELFLFMESLCRAEGWIFEFTGALRVYRRITDVEFLVYRLPRFSN